MSFQEPVWLVMLLFVPLMLFLYIYVQQRRSRYSVRFTNVNLLANVVKAQPRWRRHVPALFFLVAFALLALAVARPEADREVPREEATVVLVVDISGSMNATDVPPTRIEAAKEASHTFLDVVPEGFSVGIISFEAVVRLDHPPNRDREAARAAIDRLRAEGGTAIGDALMFALDVVQTPEEYGGEAPGEQNGNDGAREDNNDPPGAILFMTDGFNTAGIADPIDAGREAAARGIPVYTVAFGTPDGYVDIFNSAGRLQRVAVPPDVETMSRIADMTGAETYTAVTAEELSAVYQSVSARIGVEIEKQEVTWAFAAAAMLMLVLGASLSLYWFNRFP
jgi:Ca-activated chloride channel homolog